MAIVVCTLYKSAYYKDSKHHNFFCGINIPLIDLMEPLHAGYKR